MDLVALGLRFNPAEDLGATVALQYAQLERERVQSD